MILDFEKVATIVDLEAHYPESFDAYRAELERQAQQAVAQAKLMAFAEVVVAWTTYISAGEPQLFQLWLEKRAADLPPEAE